MKFLRIGKVGQEIPVVLDDEGKYRNLSSVIKDLNPESINFETLDKIKEIDLKSLEEISQNERIGVLTKSDVQNGRSTHIISKLLYFMGNVANKYEIG